jgi:tetratricopeptide (TPR) repeat protein
MNLRHTQVRFGQLELRARWVARIPKPGAVLVAAVLLVALGASAAPAAPPKKGRVIAFSDADPISESFRRDLNKHCPPAPPRGRPLSFDTALANVKVLVRGSVGGKPLVALAKSKYGTNASEGMSFVAGAVAAGSPGAALAELILLYERKPNEAGPLVDASALVTSLGRPWEALAFLDRAEQLTPPAARPMGIKFRALILNNRGYALIALHNYAKAKQVLRSAAGVDPLLAEARANLALAMACSGGSGVDNPPKPPEPPEPGTSAGPTPPGARRNTFSDEINTSFGQMPPPEALFDLSRGVGFKLPSLPLPQTIDAAIAYAPFYDRLREQAKREFDALSQRTRQLKPWPADASSLWRSRTLAITEAGSTESDPRFHALSLSLEDALNAPEQVRIEAFGAGGPAAPGPLEFGNNPTPQQCAEFQQRWLVAMHQMEQASAKLADAAYRRATAAAANLSYPSAHEQAQLYAKEEALLWYHHVVGAAWLWTQQVAGHYNGTPSWCGATPQGTPPSAPEPKFEPAKPCGPPVSALEVSFGIDDVLKASINCEAVSFRLTGKGPLLQPFVELSIKPGTNVTLYVGEKVSTGIPIPDAIAPSLEGGVYVTYTSGQGVTDMGVRASASLGFTAGADISNGINVAGSGSPFSTTLDFNALAGQFTVR